MSVAGELSREYAEIRKRLRKPPNAVIDPGIDLTRKSTAYKGDIPPPDTPPKKKLVPETVHPPLKLPIRFEDILQEVSLFYNISRERLMSQDRTKLPVLARRVIIFLSLRLLQNGKRSVSSIARDLDQDHTTVLHARNKLNSILPNNENLSREIRLIEEKILASYRLKFDLSNERESSLENGQGEGLSEPGIHGLDQGILGPVDAAEAPTKG